MMKTKVKTKLTKAQEKFMNSVFRKNCDTFKELMRDPGFMGQVQAIQKRCGLPIVLRDPLGLSRRLILKYVQFWVQMQKPGLRLMDRVYGEFSMNSQRFISLLSMLLCYERLESSRNKSRHLVDLRASLLTGWSDCDAEKKLIRMLDAQCGNEPLKKTDPELVEKVKSLRCTDVELRAATFAWVLSQVLSVLFDEQVGNLLRSFCLGPEWFLPIHIFVVTGENPVEVGCIPYLNVGVSNRMKDNFSFDVTDITINQDFQCALKIMQQQGLKSSFRNYPYKNREQNIEIEELSKEKFRVREEIRDEVKKKKEELRKYRRDFDKKGRVFDDDDYDEILSEVKGAFNDQGIGARVFSERVNATAEQLADVTRHRLFRHKRRKESRFRPSFDSKPGK